MDPTLLDRINHYATLYPNLPHGLWVTFAKYDEKVATEGIESTRNAPIVPDRIKNRHPLFAR